MAVAGEGEVGVVEVVGGGVIGGGGEGGIEDAAEGGLGLCVCGGDLDFLEAEDVGPVPSLEVCAE